MPERFIRPLVGMTQDEIDDLALDVECGCEVFYAGDER